MSELTKFGFKKLGDKGYATWRTNMKGVLLAKGYAGALTKDDDTNSDKALGLLTMCVMEQHHPTIEGCKNAKEAWDAVAALFRQKSTANILGLKRDMSHLEKKPKESVSQFVARARELSTELSAAGSKVEESDLVLSILDGLPKEYEVVTTVVGLDDKLPTIKDLMAKLLIVEKRLPNLAGTEEKAYVHDTKPKYPRELKGNKPELRACWHCGKKGHLKKDCRLAKAQRADTGKAPPPTSRPQVALMATNDGHYDERDWVVDTGATLHCENVLMFSQHNHT